MIHIPYIFACHLQIIADLDPAYHFDVDPDPDTIVPYNLIRIHADPDP
jgi:hypothetical protein